MLSHASVPDEVSYRAAVSAGKRRGPQHQQALHLSRSSQAVARDGHFNSEATLSTGTFVQIAELQASRRKSPTEADEHGSASEHGDNDSGRVGGETPSTDASTQSDSSANKKAMRMLPVDADEPGPKNYEAEGHGFGMRRPQALAKVGHLGEATPCTDTCAQIAESHAPGRRLPVDADDHGPETGYGDNE